MKTIVVALAIALVGCPSTPSAPPPKPAVEMAATSGTLEFNNAAIPVDAKVEWPRVIEAGKSAAIRVSVTNRSKAPFAKVRVRLEMSKLAGNMPGNQYTEGFSIDGTIPSGGRVNGYESFRASDFAGVGSGDTKTFGFAITAVKPGGYSAKVMVAAYAGEDDIARYDAPITTVIKAPL